MDGEHLVYRTGGTLDGGPHEDKDVILDLIHCVDGEGCSSPQWECEADSVAVMFSDGQGNNEPLFAAGSFDSPRSITGTCQGADGNGPFTFDRCSRASAGSGTR